MYIGIVIFTLLCELAAGARNPLNPLSDEFIDLINKEGKWKAGRNFNLDTPIKDIMQLLGTEFQLSDYKNVPVVHHDIDLINSLPESFDARDKWPNCPSLREIRDQGRCGSCYAFGAAEAMTDRVCIFSNGTKNFHFSTEDIVTCLNRTNGCFGGNVISPWIAWTEEGFVSGGNYNSHEGCRPYTVPTCAHHMMSCTNYTDTPPCKTSCRDGYNVTYEQDKKRGENIRLLFGESDYMAEIFENGPIETAFTVYSDFVSYKGGVYQHVAGDKLSGHAVKVMGWGVDNGTKYWLIANSWNTDFGENGFFRMLRGVDECRIERCGIAGDPMLQDY